VQHFLEALTIGLADAVLAASLIHYRKGIMDLKGILKEEV
jgi:imidazole glycerol phosphate synthase subunit HisF